MIVLWASLGIAFGADKVFAQEAQSSAPPSMAQANAGERRVPLTEQPIATDAAGRAALAARLRSPTLSGTIDAPARNARLVLENRSPVFYTYVSGWATFYDAEGVRCGEGLFTLDALATGEAAETDMPGLRLTCAAASWRIVAVNLLTRTGDTATRGEPAPRESSSPASPQPSSAPVNADAVTTTTALPPLVININGETLPVQLNNPLDIKVGGERLKIVVSAAP